MQFKGKMRLARKRANAPVAAAPPTPPAGVVGDEDPLKESEFKCMRCDLISLMVDVSKTDSKKKGQVWTFL